MYKNSVPPFLHIERKISMAMSKRAKKIIKEIPHPFLMVLINSMGGVVNGSENIILALRSSQKHIMMFGYEKIYSAAFNLFIRGGDYRVCMENTKFFIHPPNLWVLKDEKLLADAQEAEAKNYDLIAKKTGNSFEEIKELSNKKTLLSASDAKKFNFVHDIWRPNISLFS